jgi:hypothetical protein
MAIRQEKGVAAMERRGEGSPRLKARIAGLFFLLMCVMGGLVQIARGGLIVSGDAAATATNVVAHPASLQLAYIGDLLVVVAYLVVTALFYELFKPVNGTVALLATFLSLAGCTIQGSACLFELAPTVVLGGAQYLHVFSAEQLQALAYLFLKLYSQVYSIALVFFAFYGLLIGYLVFVSTFLPRFLGVLLMIAGLAWLTFLSPPLGAKYLYPYILATDIGEGSLILWLLVAGVNAERWKERAARERT